MKSITELADLTGRCALISGGAGHIGLAAAETLIELGGRVAIVDRDPTACRRRAQMLEGETGGAVMAVPCDLSNELATRNAVREVVRALGGLDILIHCAAWVGSRQVDGWAVPFEQQTVSAWDAALRVNLTSAFVLAQEARAALERSGRGSVMLFSSIYGIVGPDFRLYTDTTMANPGAYGASKGGLIQLMRYLATELAPATRVNAITPGGLWRDQPKNFVERYEERTPLGRMAYEEDVKGAVAFLASDLSAYVTGHNLIIDGGWTVW